jgi:hypothetical protein
MNTHYLLGLPRQDNRIGERLSAVVILYCMLLQMILPIVPVRPYVAPVAIPAAAPLNKPLPAGSTIDGGAVPGLPYPLPAVLQGKTEIAALRTGNTATFDMGDGTVAVLQDVLPLHYQDATGGWQHIDPTFTAVADGWMNNTNQIRISTADRSSAALIGLNQVGVQWQPAGLELVSAAGESSTIATLRSATEAPLGVLKANGAVVRYTGSWAMTDGATNLANLQDQWQSRPGSVEYTMRLAELPAAPWWQAPPDALDLRVTLRLRPGASLYIDGKPVALSTEQDVVTQSALSFVSDNGEEIVLQPPATYEQTNPQARVAGSYALRATADPSVVELRVRTPWSWLAAVDRSFPVIIDPLFQVRNESHIRTAIYKRDTLEHITNDTNLSEDLGTLGRGSSGADRMLVRFAMPVLPPNSNITKAYLLTAPNDIGNYVDAYAPLQGIAANVTVHAVAETPGHWWESDTAAPAFDINSPLPPGAQTMRFSKGEELPSYLTWDVTSAAQAWKRTTIFDPVNMGLLLRADNEQCISPIAGVAIQNCGVFMFYRTPDNWSNDELIATQYFSNPNAPYLDPNSTTRGVRLIVFVQGPTLVQNSVVDVPTPGGLGLPPGDTTPFFGADHAYVIPQIPNNRWQAVVSRGITDTKGADPNTCVAPCVQYTSLAGAMPMKVQVNDSETGAQLLDRTLQSVAPVKNELGYILLNGRGAQGEYTDTDLQLRVSTATGAGMPARYDLRLIGEQTTPISATVGTRQTTNYVFDSADPLALWNVKLLPGTVNRITVQVLGDGTQGAGYSNTYAGQFRAQLVRSTSHEAMPASTGGKGVLKQWQLAMQPKSSGFITAETGQYALAIAYNGPRLTVRDIENCGAEICTDKVIPIKYDLRIQVTSCPAGEFPTQDGGCQKVECPNTTNFPANASTFEEVGGLRVWNKAGWTRNGNSGVTIASNSAPLVGPPGGAAPTVAVIGGSISYTQTNTIKLSSKSTVILVQCPPINSASGAWQQAFDVFEGAMERQLLMIGLTTRPILRAAPAGSGQMLQDPWPSNDKSSLSNLDFYIAPLTATAHGAATLSRAVGEQGALKTLKFNPVWSWPVTGWPDFASSVSADQANPAPPTIASLNLNLGGVFQMDVEPADGQNQRRFTGVRSRFTTISQQPQLGGASEVIQSVILPRNAPLPVLNKSCVSSCIDLRAPDDVANLPAPRRNWKMPDVLTNIDANTVMMSSAGVLQVYSTDHPTVNAASANAFAKEFSFGAGEAKVELDFAPCGGVGPDVFIVRGSASMSIPNVGGQVDGQFMLCETSLRSVHMSFESPVGIPLGNSGLFLTGLSGGVDIFPDYTTITVGLNFQAAPGGNGGAFRASGQVVIDTRGLFEFQGSGKVLGTVNVDGKVWVAWNPLDTGFEVSVSVGNWLTGFARAHLWVGQGWQNRYSWLPDNDEKHFAGEIGATLTIKEGAIADWELLSLPPGDISIGIELAFGQFCTNSSCTTYEWGIKGKFVVMGYDVGLYYGFDEGLDFILGNDDHLLIDEYGGYQVISAGMNGADTVTVQAAPQKVNGQALIPFTVSAQAEQILVGLGWQAGSPQLSLITPDGVEINAGNAAANGAQAAVEADNAVITVQSPKAGAWQAKIANLSEQGVEHYKFMYLANKGAPGTAGNRGQFVNPANLNEPGNNSYMLRWSAPADAPDGATISLSYYRTEVITGNLELGVPIVKNLPFKTGEYAWNTTGLLNGSYQVRAEVDDGFNSLPTSEISQPDNACLPLDSGLPKTRAFDANRFPGTVVFTATGTIAINDVTPPAAPTGLFASGVDGAIMTRWNPSPEQDVNSYLLRWHPSIQADPNNPQGVVQMLVAATEQPVHRIDVVSNDTTYALSIAALDINGNASPFTAPLFVTPNTGGNPLPAAPISLTVTSRSADSISLSWAPGNAVVPTGYRIKLMKLDETAATSVIDVVGAGGTLNGLATGAAYAIWVAAGNSDGWFSPYSTPIQTLVTSGVDGNGDGMADDWAARFGLSDPNGDPDGDGLSNKDEYLLGANPLVQDSDGDDFSDAEEKQAGTDPLDGLHYGAEFTQPRLLLTENKLSFTAKKQAGGEAAAQSVQWRNTGGGALQLQASSDAAWINASVVNDQVQVGVNHGSLTPGFYSGVVKLNPAPGSGPIIGDAACIRVNTWVLPADNDVPTPPVLQMMYLPIVTR